MRSPFAALPVPPARLRDYWERAHWLAAGAVAAVGVLAMGRPFVARHGLGPPLPHRDTVILEYVGWYVARGNTLYTDIWEIKPPLAFLPPYLVARVTGTNMYALHVAGMVMTACCLVVTVALASRLVGRLTDCPTAGFCTGVAFLAVPDLFHAPWTGYKAKALVFALGTLALDAATRDRPFGSGVAAGLAVGVWQLGVLFPVLTTLFVRRTGSRRALRRHLAGGGVAALVVLVVLLALGDPVGFLAEVVLTPLVMRTDGGGFGLAAATFFTPAAGVVLGVLAGLGLLVAARDPYDRPTRPLAIGGLLVVLVLVLDFDGLWDTLTPLLFLAVAAGLFVGRLSPRRRVVLLLVLSVPVVAGFAPTAFLRPDPVELGASDGRPPAVMAERETVFWEARSIRSCRFFGAGTQRSILAYYPGADVLAEAPCGELEPYWRALRD